jgi:hypothetical protein
MPDGDTCQGRWSSAAGAGITLASGSLLSQYGSTYISGFSLSTGRGQNPGQALIVCGKGRTFQLEFVTGAGTAHGFGIGKITSLMSIDSCFEDGYNSSRSHCARRSSFGWFPISVSVRSAWLGLPSACKTPTTPYAKASADARSLTSSQSNPNAGADRRPELSVPFPRHTPLSGSWG